MDRLENFEKLLSDVKARADFESKEIERLKAEGKEKTATYKQYLGNKLMYKFMLDRFRSYGLTD